MRRFDWLNVAVYGSIVVLWVGVGLLIGFEL